MTLATELVHLVLQESDGNQTANLDRQVVQPSFSNPSTSLRSSVASTRWLASLTFRLAADDHFLYFLTAVLLS
jgi:hypothetical protein